ncbi:hypothetical protein COB55_00975 [Candidatus Wolfebacteria bacterium]|nr:MAG: hypothetical protein COB55_00975 [Candidatus Wolfebacteria bacterium]
MDDNTNVPNDEYRDTYTVDDEDFNEGDGNKGVLVIIISLLVGFSIGWFSAIVAAPYDSIEEVDEEVVDTLDQDVDSMSDGELVVVDEERTIDPSTVAISVNDQEAGDQVLVSLITTPSASWVVVYEDNAGTPGSILGARLVDVGETADIRVELQRETVASKLYYVMIHPDDGDAVFDFKMERPYTDDAGARIFKSFTTSDVVAQ